MDYSKSTSRANSTTLESLKRLTHILVTNINYIFPFAIALSLANRIIVYVLLPSAIGSWNIDVSKLDLDTYSTTTQVLLTIPTLLQYPLFTVMILYVFQKMFGTEITITQAITHTLKRLHIILITALLYFISIAIGCMLLVLPGVYILGAFGMAIPAVVIDKKGIISSLKHSKTLTSGSVMFVLLVLLSAIIIPNMLALIVGSSLSYYINNMILNELIIILFISISSCILVTAFVFIYKDLLLRTSEKELIAAKIAEEEAIQ
jgi:hypothetical protein